METKSYTLSNGQTVTQRKLTLRQLANLTVLLTESLLTAFTADSKEADIAELIGKLFSKSDLANKFFRIIISPNTIPDSLDIMEEDADLLIGAVDDFFSFNSNLIKLLQNTLQKLDLKKLTSTLSSSEPKS